MANPKGYIVATGYKWLSSNFPEVPWCQWIWNRLNVPNHRFIGWMILNRKIRVRAKLARIGITNNPLCPICEKNEETVDHLFFECEYSQACCNQLGSVLQIQNAPKNIEECNQRLSKIRGRFRRQVIQSAYIGLLYVIWQQRNRIVWQKSIIRPDVAIQQMLWDVHYRIYMINPKKTSQENRQRLKSILCNKTQESVKLVVARLMFNLGCCK